MEEEEKNVYMCVGLGHFSVQQKQTQHSKATILKVKQNKKIIKKTKTGRSHLGSTEQI